MRNSATEKIISFICDILNLMFVWSVTMIRIIPALQLLERVADGDQNLDKDGCRSLEVVHQVSKAGVVAEPWKKRIYGFSCPSCQCGHSLNIPGKALKIPLLTMRSFFCFSCFPRNCLSFFRSYILSTNSSTLSWTLRKYTRQLRATYFG